MNTYKNIKNPNVYGPYLKAVVYYGEAGLSTCVYIGKNFVFPTLILDKEGKWKKLNWRKKHGRKAEQKSMFS